MAPFSKLIFSVAMFLLSQSTTIAQCPAVTLTAKNGNCLGTASLSLSGADSAIKIVWYRNGTAVKTFYKNGYASNGTTVAGGNGPGYAANQLNSPQGVYVDAGGNIFVADIARNINNYYDTSGRVQKWVPGADSGITVAGGNGYGSGANQLNYELDVHVDPSGNIFIADAYNHRIQKWAPGATSGITVAGGNGAGAAPNQLNLPYGVFVDTDGNIFIADTYNHRIQKWAPGATSGITSVGSYGSAANQLWGPSAVYVDTDGNVFISDTYNNRIQKWARGASSGITIAGGNGAGSAVNQLNQPRKVHVDTAGNIFIPDGNIHRIQKWDFMPNKGIDTNYMSVAAGNYTSVATFPGGCTVTSNELAIIDTLSPIINSFFPKKAGSGTTVTIIGSHFSNGTVVSFGGVAAASFIVVNDATITAITGNGANGSVSVKTTTCTGVASLGGFEYCAIPTPVLSVANTCLSDTLRLSGADSALQIAWYKNGTLVKTVVNKGYDSSGITVAGGNGAGTAANQINFSYGLNVDAAGNIFIADAQNNRIQKWGPGATSGTTVAGGNGLGTAANQLYSPNAVFVDAVGNLFISDRENHRIQKWAPGATNGITVAGGNGRGAAASQLNKPSDVFVDKAGNIFIADKDNHRIQKWAPGATSGITIAGGNGYGSAPNKLWSPSAVKVDATGNIFIADWSNNRIQKWALGAISGVTVAGGNGAGSAANQLNGASSIYVDSLENIFIADSYNNRIQKWAPGTEIGITVAGGNGAGGAPHQLNFPAGVFVIGTGDIFITDLNNHRVQKWAILPSTGIDTTYLPTSTSSYTAVATFPGGCTVTSNVAIVTSCNYWTGAVNNLWNVPGNWSSGVVPDANTAVFINSGTVVVSADAVCYSLTVAPGVNVTVNTGVKFTVLH